ncbi:MAG: hypothetical protein ACXW4T_01575 [Candidatus Limnocylindrales bacterium]
MGTPMDSMDAAEAPSGGRASDPLDPTVVSLATIVGELLGPPVEGRPVPLVHPARWLGDTAAAPVRTGAAIEAALAAAFLARVAGAGHPTYDAAVSLLDRPPDDAPVEVVDIFQRTVRLSIDEVERVATHDPRFAATLVQTADRLRDPALDGSDAAEACWAVFIPEAVGIIGREAAREAALRGARQVTLRRLADDPMRDPGREVLFTSNVLLTLPTAGSATAELPYPPDVIEAIHEASRAPQQFWYDHPIQIGVPPDANELVYGLRGLDAAIGFERHRAPASEHDASPVVCLLSVSVTHEALQRIARPYVEAELGRSGALDHLEVYVVTEDDARRLLDAVLPDDGIGGASADAEADVALRAAFGVDGEYGRHYTFLKAIAALWHVVVDPAVRATFKIDLDQVFPQDVLVAETGQSAFEHLTTPRWGATGIDASGREVELGMIAGALVNERDIGRGLFTPDVPYPKRARTPDEHVFFSVVPQAVSTRAEMMTRYDSGALDGTHAALERIHVTGGTNGIRVDTLRRHRPFTPSFIGRAEDQAYVLSTLGQSGPRLAYVHEPGLVMRHDKEAFAGDAIAAAHVGKLIGDDVRILLFSAYVDAVAGPGEDGTLDRSAIKTLLDPFTGAFVSRIPTTVVMIRFALRILDFFTRGDDASGRAYARDGARRIAAAMAVTSDAEALRTTVERERAGWARFYDTLDALEASLAAGDPAAVGRQRAAREILEVCRVRSPGH